MKRVASIAERERRDESFMMKWDSGKDTVVAVESMQ